MPTAATDAEATYIRLVDAYAHCRLGGFPRENIDRIVDAAGRTQSQYAADARRRCDEVRAMYGVQGPPCDLLPLDAITLLPVTQPQAAVSTDPLCYTGRVPVTASPPPPPTPQRSRPHPRDAFWPNDLPAQQILHESIHCIVGSWLGLRVLSCVAYADGSGLTALASDQSDPMQLAFVTVATLAPAAFLDRIGHGFETVNNDLRQAEEYTAKYRTMTGRSLNAWRLAHATLRVPEVGDSILRLARAMRFGVSLTHADVERICGPAQTQAEEQVPVAETDPAEQFAAYAGA